MTVHYISTRGSAAALSFEEVVLAGLASDGGLFVPEHIPTFDATRIAAMASLPYAQLAYEIMAPFVDGLAPETLKSIIDDAYKSFRHPDIAPLKTLDERTHILELFHGPTLAFKDFALQFLGRLLDHILTKRKQHAVIVGATSGDTGSAAIAGCRGRAGMDIFILHPKGRVSDVQRRQMTTVLDANVHNIALTGTFDDCQDVVKALFNDKEFRAAHRLTAVNSINWARILAQVVYYFYAALKLSAPKRAVDFCVPTGNFGDIYAGYIAKKMGLPIGTLIIATNRNDILARTLATGTYGMEGVVPTLSPSMDIQISSNFERLLFDLYRQDSGNITALMADLRNKKQFTLSAEALAAFRADFAAGSADDAETKRAIADVHQRYGELLDPHTAVGYAVGAKYPTGKNPLVILATAHPAKFPDAVKDATGITPALPPHMADLLQKPERFDVLENNAAAVKSYMASRLA